MFWSGRIRVQHKALLTRSTLDCKGREKLSTRAFAFLVAVTRIGQGRIDLTIGSALDIFGGTGVRYQDAVAFNRGLRKPA
jgi:hypothetical protein